MSTELTLTEHLDGLRAALASFASSAERAGLDADVPTCPDWTVRRLLAHQGMVHRWAIGALRGESVDADTVERAGLTAADPVAWLRDGAESLVAAIEAAPEDVRTVVFLNDAPPGRRFWGRRQCHETTMHAVDALSAALGGYPRGTDTWIDPALARDGIDELLAGFLTRNHSRLRCEEPLRVAVRPDDAEDAWLVEVSRRPPVTLRRPGDAVLDAADVELRASSVSLYLALWNRSDEVDVAPDLWGRWREQSPITWS